MSTIYDSHVGKRVRVHHCIGGYMLPDGLPELAEVTLVEFDHGYWTARYNGQLFKVALPCVGEGGMLPPATRTRRER
jgi:hypothetical protein